MCKGKKKKKIMKCLLALRHQKFETGRINWNGTSINQLPCVETNSNCCFFSVTLRQLNRLRFRTMFVYWNDILSALILIPRCYVAWESINIDSDSDKLCQTAGLYQMADGGVWNIAKLYVANDYVYHRFQQLTVGNRFSMDRWHQVGHSWKTRQYHRWWSD